MTVPESSASLETAWKRQAEWSAVASRQKGRVTWRRGAILVLLSATAVLETLAARLAEPEGLARTVAVLGAGLAGLALFLQTRAKSEDTLDRWTRSRSAAEALKEQVYRYLARTGAYRGADPDAVLRAEVQRVLDDVSDLHGDLAGVEVPLPTAVPPVGDVKDYVAQRVEQQIDRYYRPRSDDAGRRRDQWRAVQTVLLMLTTILSALVAVFPEAGLAAWVAVLTTLAGTVGAHLEAARYEHLALSYRATAMRLETLRDEWKDSISKEPISPDVADHFVDRCERAISTENEAWLAGWTKKA